MSSTTHLGHRGSQLLDHLGKRAQDFTKASSKSALRPLILRHVCKVENFAQLKEERETSWTLSHHPVAHWCDKSAGVSLLDVEAALEGLEIANRDRNSLPRGAPTVASA